MVFNGFSQFGRHTFEIGLDLLVFMFGIDNEAVYIVGEQIANQARGHGHLFVKKARPLVFLSGTLDTLPSVDEVFQIAFEFPVPLALRLGSDDDTEPTRDSSLYTQPFSVNRTTTVRCSVFPLADGIATAGSAVTLHRHDGIGRLPDLLHPYSQRYPGGGHRGLLDGIFGSDYYNDGHWQGFEEIDMDVIIDLERSVPINDLRARFLQNVRVWIFLPTRVSFYVSEDGDEFDLVGQSDRGVAEDQGGSFVRDFSTAGDGGSYRYVRVHAENIGVCPPWHGGAGGKAWVFADEILVNADPQERPASP